MWNTSVRLAPLQLSHGHLTARAFPSSIGVVISVVKSVSLYHRSDAGVVQPNHASCLPPVTTLGHLAGPPTQSIMGVTEYVRSPGSTVPPVSGQ